ncbi:hypothetical protein D3C80_1947040 [compost metagenome]
MTTGAGCHGNQAVRPLANGRLRVAIVDNVMQDNATIRMNGGIDLWNRAQR